MIHYLMDVSWILYRGYFTAKSIWDEYPEIHFLCKKITSLLERKDVILHLCIDGCNVKGKKLLTEQYKSGRHQEGSYNVYLGLSAFIHLLNNKRIKIYFNNNYEADELIFTLSRILDGRKKILSGDKDLFQAITDEVFIDNGNNEVITLESYKHDYKDKFFEISPDKLPLYRAIIGDPSDCLKPAVARFPHKLAAKLVNDFNYNGNLFSIEDIRSLSSDYTSSDKKWIDKLICSYESLKLNFDIMKLNVITDNITDNEYDFPIVEFSDFLKSKILKLNTL